MDTLVSLGYWGLFIGSFLASTVIPMSADVLLVGVLKPMVTFVPGNVKTL